MRSGWDIVSYCCWSMLFCLSFALILPSPAAAATASGVRPFDAGSGRLSLHLGGATAFNRDYSIFGLGFGYYVANGVEVGLDAETWFGNSPRIQQISPQLRLVIDARTMVRPYMGLYYRRTFIDGFQDTDTIGARAGVYFLTHGSAFFGAGAAVENHLNCDRTIYASCTEAYPELFVAVVF